jgi:hypothetical protein
MAEDKGTEQFLALLEGFQRVIFQAGDPQELTYGKAGEMSAGLDIDIGQIGNAMMFALSQLAVQDGSMLTPELRRSYTDHLTRLFNEHYMMNEGLIADVEQRGLHANDR